MKKLEPKMYFAVVLWYVVRQHDDTQQLHPSVTFLLTLQARRKDEEQPNYILLVFYMDMLL